MRYLGDECTGIAQLVERQARGFFLGRSARQRSPITIVQVTDKLCDDRFLMRGIDRHVAEHCPDVWAPIMHVRFA